MQSSEYNVDGEDYRPVQDYRVHGQATVNLTHDANPTTEKFSVAKSSYANPGPREPSVQSHSTSDLQRSRIFDGHPRDPTPLSTQRGLFVSHSPSPVEPHPPPPAQVDLLTMPNVNSKEMFQSSYKNSHTGELPSESDRAVPSPNITFKSNVVLEDAEKNRPPLQSTQQGNYTVYPASSAPEPHPPPKHQIDLSMPNVDHKDSFQSSYRQMHTGELPSVDDRVENVPRTTFQSSVDFNDGDNHNTATRFSSTQRDNFVSSPVPPVVHYAPPPKTQVDFTQPNLDQRDLYQTSYKQLHSGEPQSTENQHTNVPRTTFHSSLQFDDGEVNRAPYQSTQQGNYTTFSTPTEVQYHAPPKAQLDLSQPNVNPSDSFQTSYKQSHAGRPPVEDNNSYASNAPNTTFHSSLNFDDGEANRGPYQSTQQGNYTNHPAQHVEYHAPPKTQLDLTQPNVNHRDSFQSSYQQSHTGELPSASHYVAPVPQNTFQSSLAFDDGEQYRRAPQSTQQDNYATYSAPEAVHYAAPPKSQNNINQQHNVDPRETFTSSYSNSHTGEPLAADDVVYAPRTAFASSITLEDADKNRAPSRSTQQDNYAFHPPQEVEHYVPPRGQISFSQPNVDPKDNYTSSYKNSHTGEVPSDYEVASVPRTAFTSSIALEDAERNRTPHKSTQQENYAAHPAREVEHYAPPKAQISLSQPNVDPKDAFQSSYKRSHTGEPVADDGVVYEPKTAFASSIVMEDADRNRTPRRSTQKDNYMSHPVQEVERHAPPKGQISLTQPNVDPKDAYQSSYKNSHKGEAPAEGDEVTPARTAFTSSIALEDAERSRAPSRSTQQDNYAAHPAQEVEHYAPPKSHINLTQPNVDPKEAFQSSYNKSHTGEPIADDGVVSAPRTAFASSIVMEDADRNRAPRRSTQQDNYMSHPAQETERHAPPKAQINLSQPNVDPKDAYQSSYSNSHQGQAPAAGDETVPAPRTAFASSIALEDAERSRTPQRSTQQDNYAAHPAQEVEYYAPPKSQISLSQPNVDPKDAYQSSYNKMHTGEPIEDDGVVSAPRTAFASSIVMEDADRNRTPRRSTQKDNYMSHPTQEVERHAPPKGQINLTQPNLDPKDAYQSSYKNSHTGAPVEDDGVVSAPRTAFASSIVMEDADRNRTPRRSTQQDNYKSHPAQETERHAPPKGQINLSQPNVDPKDAYQSSYKNSHKGEAPAEGDEVTPARTAFTSSIALEDAEKSRKPQRSTQQDNYAAHPAQEVEHCAPPKSQINLSQPNVDPKDAFISSNKNSYRGETPVNDEVTSSPKTAFKSSIVLEDADRNRTPRRSTQRDTYASHPVQELEQGTPPKSSINLSQPNVDPKKAFTSSYKDSHKGEAPSEDDDWLMSPPQTAFKSSITLEDADNNRAPRKSTQQDNYPSHPIYELRQSTPPKAQINLSQPNVDPKEAFTSSYKNSHKGEAPTVDDAVTSSPQTAFKSSIVLEDADKDKTPKRSTQKENYPYHPPQETEQSTPPKSQINLSQPNVNPKDAFTSSYKNSHKGELPHADDEVTSSPQTAFKSSILLEDADKNRTPRKSTQRDTYAAHPVQEVEQSTPPKSHINLSQPNVDPKEAFKSSYRDSHKGEAPTEDVISSPQTAFKSSFVLEDADKDKTPKRSTQKENYPYHPPQETEQSTPPKSQINLSQPNVDPKDAFTSSYKKSHKGEAPSAEDEVVSSPNTAFKSSIVLEDADKNRTPRKSTQRDTYASHPVQEMEHPTPPKSHINLSQPNVDPKEAFQSSYNKSHTGEAPSADDEVIPARTAFTSSIALEDAERSRTPQKSTQRENYAAHPAQEVEHYAPPKSHINLSQPNVDPKEAFQSSYNKMHTGEPVEDDGVVSAPRTAFASSIVMEDADRNRTPRKSTQQENYKSHPVQETERHAPPKTQINLSQPNVDPKEAFQSSYKNLHKGEALSADDEVVPARTAFASSIALEDAERSRTPQKSTQRENYAAHPAQEVEHYTPPKSYINLSQPNVDPKEAFQSSYNKMHTGEPIEDDGVVYEPRTAFASSITLEDADKNRTPRRSTQQENYKSHPVQESERHAPPKAQINLSQPNVDPKEAFQSSYKKSHTGEAPSAEDEAIPARTAFASSIALEDAERSRTPQKSTQQENYAAHPAQEVEHYAPPKSQISLSQPNVDPKEAFQSSYNKMHTGEPVEDDGVAYVPRAAFASSIVMEDADRNRTPRKSTQQENYKSHPVQETERHAPPKAQINLSQPNVDPKEGFQSSYKKSHTGELLSADDEAVPARTAFASSIALEDADKNRTPRKSTQRETYPSHPVQEMEQFVPPKSQISLSQPNVDPKESFQSSYKNTHKGELPPPSNEAIPARTAFVSNITLEEGYKTPQSSQKDYVAHPVSKQEHHPPPKAQLDLTQPNINQKELMQSSYRQSHRPESPTPSSPVLAAGRASPAPSRSAFQSTLSLDEGKSQEPMVSTSQKTYATPSAKEYEEHTGRRGSQDAGRSTRSSITLGTDSSPVSRASTSSSTYARPSQEAIKNASPSKPHSNRQNYESSFSLGERDQRVSTPTPTSRDAYTQRPSSAQSTSAAGRPRPQMNESVSFGTEQTSYASSSSAAYPRPQTAPQPASSSLKSGDLHRSSIQFSSAEPTFSPRFRGTNNNANSSSAVRSSDSSFSPSQSASSRSSNPNRASESSFSPSQYSRSSQNASPAPGSASQANQHNSPSYAQPTSASSSRESASRSTNNQYASSQGASQSNQYGSASGSNQYSSSQGSEQSSSQGSGSRYSQPTAASSSRSNQQASQGIIYQSPSQGSPSYSQPTSASSSRESASRSNQHSSPSQGHAQSTSSSSSREPVSRSNQYSPREYGSQESSSHSNPLSPREAASQSNNRYSPRETASQSNNRYSPRESTPQTNQYGSRESAPNQYGSRESASQANQYGSRESASQANQYGSRGSGSQSNQYGSREYASQSNQYGSRDSASQSNQYAQGASQSIQYAQGASQGSTSQSNSYAQGHQSASQSNQYTSSSQEPASRSSYAQPTSASSSRESASRSNGSASRSTTSYDSSSQQGGINHGSSNSSTSQSQGGGAKSVTYANRPSETSSYSSSSSSQGSNSRTYANRPLDSSSSSSSQTTYANRPLESSSQTTYANRPVDSSSSSQTTYANRPIFDNSSPSHSSSSHSNNTSASARAKSPNPPPTRPDSPYGNRTRSSITFGNDQPSYQTTNRSTFHTSPPTSPSPTPTSPTITVSPSSPARAARHSQLRSSFSLG